MVSALRRGYEPVRDLNVLVQSGGYSLHEDCLAQAPVLRTVGRQKESPQTRLREDVGAACIIANQRADALMVLATTRSRVVIEDLNV